MQPDRLRTELLELILNFTGSIRVGVKRAKLFCTVLFPAYHPLLIFCLETYMSDEPRKLDSSALVALFHAILSFSKRERQTIGQGSTSWQKWSIFQPHGSSGNLWIQYKFKVEVLVLKKGVHTGLPFLKDLINLLQWICKLFFSLITDWITWQPHRTPIIKLHHLSVAMIDSPAWQSYHG